MNPIISMLMQRLQGKNPQRLPNGTTDDEWEWKSRGSVKTNF